MGFITLNLKLYKPTRIKKKIMEQAMESYSRAFNLLTRKALQEEETFQAMASRPNFQQAMAKWIQGDLSKALNDFGVQPFKDALKIDFAMFMSGYLGLKRKFPDTPRPCVYVEKRELSSLYARYLEEVTSDEETWCSDLEMEKRIGKLGKYRPVYFCRTDRFRDFCLLYDEEADRFFAKIYLLNMGSSLKRVQISTDRNLRYVHKAGGVLENSGAPDRFIILPLAFGKWQEQYLKQALANPERIKTARLKKIREDFYLSVALEIKVEKPMKPEHYLSVVRGLKEPLNYAVADLEGKIVESGCLIQKEELSKGNMQVLLFKAAGHVCRIADQYRCEVLVESLYTRSDYINFRDREGVLHPTLFEKKDYLELLRILKYKLPLHSLGRPLELSPLDIFYRCPECHSLSKSNRFKQDIFICASCASYMEIDKLGSVNLARKLIHYKKSKIPIKSVQLEDGILFTNELLGLQCRCGNFGEDYIGRITGELRRISETTDYGSLSKKARSLILKIWSAEDLTQIISIV